MNFIFTDENKGKVKPLRFKVYQCNTDPKNGTIQGFKDLKKCACSYCPNSCSSQMEKFQPPSFFEGFHGLLVLLTYIVVIAITAGVYFYNKKKRQRSEPEENAINDSFVDNP